MMIVKRVATPVLIFKVILKPIGPIAVPYIARGHVILKGAEPSPSPFWD